LPPDPPIAGWSHFTSKAHINASFFFALLQSSFPPLCFVEETIEILTHRRSDEFD
jgi:hypothetical protein